MSYQVLARKYRPKTFAEMVGQNHVLQAITNALDNDRLHHAYLFTGTRGVGKTTIARLFAKALNCEEKGVSSEPCGMCSACREIDEGRFIDLVELDAASRTSVDDARELIENAQYAPTRGRFKVYLIDEVHMFSKSAFNALLKTLEEPPPHVKFLLATTDPQKLPITIISRCLQFNLKAMSPKVIESHLATVLEQEDVVFEQGALVLLAKAGNGSMRDALSLLDQTIAFGQGQVTTQGVSEMIGMVGQEALVSLLEKVDEGNGQTLMEVVAKLAETASDFSGVLADLIELLHKVAVAQAIGKDEDSAVMNLALSLKPEAVQLYYQLALMGQRDLPYAPHPQTGFEMTLLRMQSFKPAETTVAPTTEEAKKQNPQSQVANMQAALKKKLT